MSDQPLRLFREICGAPGEIRLEVTHVEGGETFRKSFALPFLVIGRHANADLVLADARVGNRHAYLQMINGRLRCIDLDSRTGIAWEDGDRRAGWLTATRRVRVGPFWIRDLTGGADGKEDEVNWPDPREAAPADHKALPEVTLEFANASPRPFLWQVNRVLTLVGRSPSCKVQLDCPSVCKFHCSLLRTAQGLLVADLLGGVSVNGRRVRWARLADRDRLRVGNYLVRVHYDSLPRAGVSAVELPEPNPSRLVPRDRPAPYAAVLPADIQLADPSLAPLVSQFAQMQHHMLEQFQQTMLAVVQTFGKLHRDQLALVRQELDRLHELTGELNALRNELTADPPAGRLFADDKDQPAGGQLPAAFEFDRAGQAEEKDPGQPPPTPEARPGPAYPAWGHPASSPTRSEGEPVSQENGGQEASPARPPRPRTADVHTWLQERFDALQRERQSSWQRILTFLRKKPPDPGSAAGASP
jgi:predicted component of type VI protein secretion system